jgi:hypothetical protein
MPISTSTRIHARIAHEQIGPYRTTQGLQFQRKIGTATVTLLKSYVVKKVSSSCLCCAALARGAMQWGSSPEAFSFFCLGSSVLNPKKMSACSNSGSPSIPAIQD